MFWHGVKQAWNGAEEIHTLHAMANDELKEKKNKLWSLPLVLPAGVPRPVPHLAEQIDDWVTVGGVWQDNVSMENDKFLC